MAQAYYSPISINAAQVPSTQSDFPVLVSQTDNRFKTVGNGGHVANSNGYDIRPYSDTALTSSLSYELERYNGTTGEVVMWVKVASLSSSTTPIYIGYGDTSLTTDGSSTSTWSNNFSAVYHLKDGTTLTFTDSSPNGRNGTATNTPTATSGQIDGAGSFVAASDQYVTLSSGNPHSTPSMTLSAWVNATSFPNSYNVIVMMNSSNNPFDVIEVKSNGKLAVGSQSSSYDGTGSNTLSTGTWYYIVGTMGGAGVGIKGYVNGSLDGSNGTNASLTGSPVSPVIAKDSVNGRQWNGKIDEVRFASVVRSADWITTEYNNQNAPGTFETLGTEVAVSTSTGNFFLLFP